MKSFEGKLIAQNIRVGIVAARFNEFITSRLLGGAMDALLRHDVSEDDVHVAWVPGCLLYTSPSPRDGLLSRMPSSA